MLTINMDRARRALQTFDFTALFIEELGWDYASGAPLQVRVDDETYSLTLVAEKRNVAALQLHSAGAFPGYALRRKIERKVVEIYREHIIIYLDAAHTAQVWQWVRREPGKPLACREHTYTPQQAGDVLLQKLQAIAFSLEEEEGLTLVDVTGRLRAAFDVERATKRFYESFKQEHDAFAKFLAGIPAGDMKSWYVSVMLNRLMFIYFIQKKGFLGGDPDYLRHKLDSRFLGKNRESESTFYHDFLCPLFFEGFAKPESQRTAETRALLGPVPYLNGGIFERHEVERHHGEAIEIPDAAFTRLFDFFDGYQWHLDDRPLRDDREINPDVLGYIFEKYINQKQMGAYYTQEDITGYISENTILPFLFERVRERCPAAFTGAEAVWALLAADPDRYIYAAVRKGCDLPLPPEIAAGVDDVSQREAWNTPTPEAYALPTEIWRETVARRQRYAEMKDSRFFRKNRESENSINDFITYNLDLPQFAQDVLESTDDPALVRAFWRELNAVSILDPTCGSGAFLFAALNILEPLYAACLERMAAFVADLPADAHPHKYKDFRETLARVAQHPNQTYFILKSIVIHNLYGVDIMAEAVEIAKLRLFLKLISQIERVADIEPLPDIDFNIRAGNTLVGFATYAEVERAVYQDGAQLKMLLDDNPMVAIEEKAQDVDRLYRRFREQQTALGGEVTPGDKAELRDRLRALDDELDRYLAKEYGVDSERAAEFAAWRASHQPFHWFVEFYGIMHQGGFDVIIGNPPYVEYRKVKKEYKLQPDAYTSEDADNLYAYCMERATILLSSSGRFGMIVPAGVLGLDGSLSLRKRLLERFADNMCSTYAIRPSKLFEGVDQRLCIYLASGKCAASDPKIWTTQYRCWSAEERQTLFTTLTYHVTAYHGRLDRIPQVGYREAGSIIQKIETRGSKRPVAIYFAQGKNGYLLHYHRSPRYWIRAMDFEQYFKSATRSRSIHHFRDLYFKKDIEGKAIGAILNSNLFFFWFISVGNGRNITSVDVQQFPVGEIAADLMDTLLGIFDRLMMDYKAHSEIRVRQDCEYQEFHPSHSKPIIDEIDRVLAQHYGFTAEELDFILNYDIKYRMGDALFEDDGNGDEES